MSIRYDRRIDADHFNPASSHEKILMQIQPGSKVLECGCATGYMTRYMRDELGCEVSIVEYDAEAYAVARQYASDGICADLMQSEWLTKFQGERFDYILFADVLEHLYDPQAVLKSVAPLLKEGGSILASVPNIAHGDVLMNLWNGNWNYTETGLLDKTHIRFFAENNLEQFFQEAGLSIVRLDCTICPVGQTEQAGNSVGIDLELFNILAARKGSTAYQFIIAAQPIGYVKQHHVKIERPIQLCQTMATLYYSQGNEFSEEHTLKAFYTAPDFHQRFQWKNNARPKFLRFDPVEGQTCVITSLQALSDQGELEICPINGYRLGNTDVFLTEDPQYSITIGNLSIAWVEIHAQIKLVSNGQIQSLITQLVRNCENQDLEIKELRQEIRVISNSFFWKITKPARVMTDALKSQLKKNRYTRLFCKGLKCWKQNGFSYAWRKFRNKLRNQQGYFRVRNPFTPKELKRQKKDVFPRKIKFSILVPLYNTPEKFLREMIRSVLAQTYGNWELCLADGSDDQHREVEKICGQYARRDARIQYKRLAKNLGISENTNACIEMASGDYIALLDHDDLLHPAALHEVTRAICEQDADFIYTDEAIFHNKVADSFAFHLKPDYAPDTLRSVNYICHLTVFKRELLKKSGRFRKECDGSQDFDLILRLTEKAKHIVHIPLVLYYWRSHSASTADNIGTKPYVINAGHRALQGHLQRMGLEGEVLDTGIPTLYRVRYAITGNPKISIIIPNQDHLDDLRACLDSIYSISTYSNFEVVIVENGSKTQEIFSYYKEIEEKWSNTYVVSWDGSFNYAAINNYGVRYAHGEYILLLNNDTRIITPEWMEEMLMFSQRKDVGVVGAKLYYPDDTIQHAGIIIGIGSTAGHQHKGARRNDYGFLGRLIYAQNLSAVTGACMMIRRDVWDEAGGLDEKFVVAFNDVDICLRIRKAGYLVVWTPYAELYHYESKSRGYEDTPEKRERFQREANLLRSRWAKELEAGDPYYNPNLTLDKEDFSLK